MCLNDHILYVVFFLINNKNKQNEFILSKQLISDGPSKKTV